MRKARTLYPLLVAAVSSVVLSADPASAAPPGEWSVAIERLFGLSRATDDIETRGSITYTSISLFAKVAGDIGYSAPRLAFDYLSSSGLTLGGALGYQSISVEGGDVDAWLFAGRVGYFIRPSSSFGVWPRGGLTHLEQGDDADATALTLEVPLEILMSRGVAFTILPHADIGIGGSIAGLDRTLTELGLQFGFGLFF